MIRQSIAEASAEAEALQKHLGPRPGARELALVRTKLEEAEMWLERSERAREEAQRP